MPKKKYQKTFEQYDMSIDIMYSIFIWLPIKSLVRFRSVYKSWKAMICDRKFENTYRDHSKALGREKLLIQENGSWELKFMDVENPQIVSRMEEKPFFPPKTFQYSSCDGLVLLKRQAAYKSYVLCNPSTRGYRNLKCPYVKYKDDPPNACGLCYNSRVDDYNVILIFRLFYVVYSLSDNSWTKKTSPPYLVQPYATGDCAHGISTQECIFWCMNKTIQGDRLVDTTSKVIVDTTSSIIYFDATTDEVKKLATPDFVGVGDYFRMTSVKGCLSLYGGKIDGRELHIWIMQQDGWKLLLNICNLPIRCFCFVANKQLLHCTKDDGKLLFGRDGFTIYYPKRQQFVRVMFGSFLAASLCLDTLYFFKSKRKIVINDMGG